LITCLPGELNGTVKPFYRILIITLLNSTATCPKIAFCCLGRFACPLACIGRQGQGL
jgi:hypothetical protein